MRKIIYYYFAVFLEQIILIVKVKEFLQTIRRIASH